MAAVDLVTRILTTIGGTFSSASDGDGGLLVNARLWEPTALAVMADGSLLTGEYGGCRVRRVDPATNIIQLFAGGGSCTTSGDGSSAITGGINAVTAVASWTDGGVTQVWIAGLMEHRVRAVRWTSGSCSAGLPSVTSTASPSTSATRSGTGSATAS
jgi:hypothetical protein